MVMRKARSWEGRSQNSVDFVSDFSKDTKEGRGFMSTTVRLIRTTFVLWCSLLGVSLTAPASAQQVIQVQCSAGGTIASALARPARSLTIVVHGTCNENVTIARDDVRLEGAPGGGTIFGPDDTKHTIFISGAARVTIQSLSVTGGFNGINAKGTSFVSMLDSHVHNTGNSGVTFDQSIGGHVDGSTIEANPLHGIYVESSSVTLTNNVIDGNKQWGIMATNGSSGRIGVTDGGQFDGNAIQNNGEGGIHIVDGSTAFVAENTISANGTNVNSVARAGIQVFNAVVDILGGNSITNHPSSGILIHGSRVRIGVQNNFTSVNTISGNGSQVAQANFPFANGGVFAYVNSSIDIRDAVISGNTGAGVSLTFRSNATLTAGQITRNTAGGIDLETGSAVVFELFQSSPAAVTGNSVADLRCNGADVRYTGFGPNALAGIGTIANSCPPANF
jgi:parallel beta-helix repeat protein